MSFTGITSLAQAWDDERRRRRFAEYLTKAFPGHVAIPVRAGQKGNRRFYADNNITAYIKSVGFDQLPWRTWQIGAEDKSAGNELGERISERVLGEIAKHALAAIFGFNIPPGV